MVGCGMFDKRNMGQMRSMMGGGVPKGKLATAESEHCSTNDKITKLIKNYKQTT